MQNNIVTIGEILMRLNVSKNKRFTQSNRFDVYFGGAEANVGVCLANWGYVFTPISAVPDNDLGESVVKYLRTNFVTTDFIYKSEGRLGLYFQEEGSMHRASKIIYDRFDSVFAKYDFSTIDIDLVLKEANWIHYTGITPAISKSAADFTLQLVTKAQKKGITVSGDINYRRNLWKYGYKPIEIMPEIVKQTNIIVGGTEDFKNCLGINESDFEKACFEVINSYPNVTKIANTNRETITASKNNLSGVLFDGNKFYLSENYNLNAIIDRIGGGDAFMAGLIYGLQNYNNQESIEFAVASSVLKHGIIGDANICSIEEANQLVKKENIGKLLR